MKNLNAIQRPWIESLGRRCNHILQMPRDEHFLARGATVAFVNAVRLREHNPEATGELWRAPSDALDLLAEECLRDQLLPVLDDAPGLSKRIREAIQGVKFPRAVTSWQDSADCSTRAHWLVARVANIGLEAHNWSDGAGDRVNQLYDGLFLPERFMSNLLLYWERDG